MEHWLFDASDYSVFHSKNDAETEMDRMDQYWDDLDYDIWYEENEYDWQFYQALAPDGAA